MPLGNLLLNGQLHHRDSNLLFSLEQAMHFLFPKVRAVADCRPTASTEELGFKIIFQQNQKVRQKAVSITFFFPLQYSSIYIFKCSRVRLSLK